MNKIVNKVNKCFVEDFGNPECERFTCSLPDIGAGRDWKFLMKKIHDTDGIVLMLGAHVIKQGLSPFIIKMIRSGKVRHVVLNGAASIHDFEIALYGKTSEPVEKYLPTGDFGMWAELEEYNAVVNLYGRSGFGHCLGKYLSKKRAGFPSILRACYECKVPCSVHVAVGTDIVHQYKNFDGAAAGRASQLDFLLLKESLKLLSNKSVVLLFGSAVIIPEVFLKALNLARYESKKKIDGFTAAAFDMKHQYRVFENVVQRPSKNGLYFIIQHEFSIPLLWWCFKKC